MNQIVIWVKYLLNNVLGKKPKNNNIGYIVMTDELVKDSVFMNMNLTC